jgi:hypothetical protein
MPAYTLDGSGSRVVALTNLSSNPDCLPGTATGRVVSRKVGSNGLVVGIEFQDDRFGRGYMNIDDYVLPSESIARIWVVKGLSELFQPGQRLSLKVAGCGAAGRVQNVEAIGVEDVLIASSGRQVAVNPGDALPTGSVVMRIPLVGSGAARSGICSMRVRRHRRNSMRVAGCKMKSASSNNRHIK